MLIIGFDQSPKSRTWIHHEYIWLVIQSDAQVNSLWLGTGYGKKRLLAAQSPSLLFKFCWTKSQSISSDLQETAHCQGKTAEPWIENKDSDWKFNSLYGENNSKNTGSLVVRCPSCILNLGHQSPKLWYAVLLVQTSIPTMEYIQTRTRKRDARILLALHAIFAQSIWRVLVDSQCW